MWAALLLHTAISAGHYLASKRALIEIGPFTLVVCRFLLSGPLFALLLLLGPGPKLPPKSEWKTLVYLGLLAGPLNQGLFFYGLSRSTPAHGALLYALTPLGVYLLSLWRGLEKPRMGAVAGIAMALLGVVILLLGRGLAEAKGEMLGDAIILGGVIAWVFFTADGKPFIARHSAVKATCWSMVSASLLVLPFGFFVFDGKSVEMASPAAMVSVLYVGLLTSVVAYLLWYYALSKTAASKVAVFNNLQPVATAFAAWLVLGTPLTWEVFVGGALVLGGVRLTQQG